jgi:biopolymer transport protein ExbB/TolQ
LTGLGLGALFFAAAAAAYRVYVVYSVAKQFKVTNLAVIAPSVAESLLCLSLGIIVMLIAVIGNWGAPKAKR